MNRYFSVKRSDLILLLVLPAVFVADLLYGSLFLLKIDLPVSPGIVVRGIILGWAFVIIFKNLRTVPSHFVVALLFLMVVGTIGPIRSFLDEFRLGSLISDGISYIKLVYLPSLAVLFYILLKKKVIRENAIYRYIEFGTYFLGVALFLAQIMGLGQSTYGDYGSGDKGIFKAQNDVSLACLLGLCVCFMRLIERPNIYRFVFISITLLALLAIGTRSALFGLIPVGSGVLISYLFSKKSELASRGARIFGWSVALGAIAFGAALFYSTYLDLSSQLYHKRKLDMILEGELPRQVLIDEATYYFSERGDVANIFGDGYSVYSEKVGRYLPTGFRKIAEVDPVDVVGGYGLVTAIYTYGLILLLTKSAVISFLRFREFSSGIGVSVMLIFVTHSTLAGHALMSPVVATFMSAILGIILYSKCSQSSLSVTRKVGPSQLGFHRAGIRAR